jgi:hypothetical protein
MLIDMFAASAVQMLLRHWTRGLAMILLEMTR